MKRNTTTQKEKTERCAQLLAYLDGQKTVKRTEIHANYGAINYSVMKVLINTGVIHPSFAGKKNRFYYVNKTNLKKLNPESLLLFVMEQQQILAKKYPKTVVKPQPAEKVVKPQPVQNDIKVLLLEAAVENYLGTIHKQQAEIETYKKIIKGLAGLI
jgi:hypothetical protein